MTQRIDRALVRAALQGATTTRHLSVAPGALADCDSLFATAFGDRPAIVITDERTFAIAGERVQRALQAAGRITGDPFIFPAEPSLNASYNHIEPVRAAILAAPPDAVPIAVGSGTINDLVKRSAYETGRPYMVVATAASMDGYTASGAALIVDGFKQTVQCPAPVAVLADTDILRAAPKAMTASGYGDLIGKVTAGADWLLADALGIEPLIPDVWAMVQGPLKATLHDPARLHEGSDPAAVEQIFLGLVITGLAIQATGSSRPASGSDHQFSHFWEMQGLSHDGRTVSHGFKVALGTLASTLLYEELLKTDLAALDIDETVSRWPSLAALEDNVRQTQPAHLPHMGERALEEVRAKYVERDEIARRLRTLKDVWPELRDRLRDQLIPSVDLRRMLQAAGCPTTPKEVGLTRDQLRTSYTAARQIRRRYTVLDLALETGHFQPAVDALFTPGGAWHPATIHEHGAETAGAAPPDPG
ncbi:MAG TPA: sn-glycerol-1-phosphate dehydrogenase [Thermomicrobiales bacterium]|nr:sn-glycerol-1-phosphate dehydrogenase [Thermomicrobiales bacterium]